MSAVLRTTASAIGCLCNNHEVAELTRRTMADVTLRSPAFGSSPSVATLELPSVAGQQTTHVPAKPLQPVMFTNCRVFDGRSSSLRCGVTILVNGNKIEAIESGQSILAVGAQRIDCGDRVLMPGLIDAHWHTMFAALSMVTLQTADIGYIHHAAGAEAERTLMRGFTTVRDAGGPCFALKKAIDDCLVAGPRIFPSGTFISQTAGHGDFRMTHEIPRTREGPGRFEKMGAFAIADSPDEVRLRTREQLMLGASQIKLMAGGGVASLYDPLDATQFRPEEIRAAVEAAQDWGTYVMAHVYMPVGIKRCIDAGVRCIEHGQLADEETVRMMVDKDIWWSLQPFIEDANANVFSDAKQQQKANMVNEGTDIAYGLAIKHEAKVGWGSDVLFEPKETARQVRRVAAMRRWYAPPHILKMVTSENAELLALCGARNPYDGDLGVIEPGAFADILVVDGDPTTDIGIIADPEKNLRIIMKDGTIFKNTL